MVKKLLTKTDKAYLECALGSLEMAVGFNKVSAFLYEYVLQLMCKKGLNGTDADAELFGEVEAYYWNLKGYVEAYKKACWKQEDWEDGGNN